MQLFNAIARAIDLWLTILALLLGIGLIASAVALIAGIMINFDRIDSTSRDRIVNCGPGGRIT